MSADSSKPAGLGKPWLVVLATLLIFFLSQFFAALFVGIGYQITNPGASLTTALTQSAPVQFSYILLAEILAIGLVILLVKKIKKVGLGAIGLGRRPVWRDVGRALLGAGAFYLLLIAASILISIFMPSFRVDEPQDIGFSALNSSFDYLLAFAALVLLPPLGEETLMRGYLYSGLRAYWRFVPAMLLTSLLFGAAHLSSGTGDTPLWAAGIDTFLLSLVLVYMRERSGALYAGILLHAMNNGIAFTIHFN